MIDIELQSVKANPQALALYLEGMSALYRSRILEVVRAVGRPRMVKLGESQDVMAAQAAWSAGFNEALDVLLNFKELFLDIKEAPEALRMDFGGVDYAVKRGDITTEEADAIRSTTNTSTNRAA